MLDTPFDLSCYQHLQSKFEFIFEPDLLKELCQKGKIHKFTQDEIIVDLGAVVSHIPLLLTGSVKVMREGEDDNELLLYYLEVGDTCAITMRCGTSNHKSKIRAIAEMDSELLFIPAELMSEWMIKYESWRRYVLDSYNSRLNEMLMAIDNLAFGNMESRIKSYLNDKVWVTKSPVLNITHHEIASDLNSSRVVISRLMKKLEKEGLFKQSRHKVEMLEF